MPLQINKTNRVYNLQMYFLIDLSNLTFINIICCKWWKKRHRYSLIMSIYTKCGVFANKTVLDAWTCTNWNGKHCKITVGDLRGGASDTNGGLNSFNFMQFLGKFGKTVCWRPLEGWCPHLGEILDPPLNKHPLVTQKWRTDLSERDSIYISFNTDKIYVV